MNDQSHHNTSVHENRFPGHLETPMLLEEECKFKTTRKAYKALPSCLVFEVGIFAYGENPFEQTLKLKKSIDHHSLLNLF